MPCRTLPTLHLTLLGRVCHQSPGKRQSPKSGQKEENSGGGDAHGRALVGPLSWGQPASDLRGTAMRSHRHWAGPKARALRKHIAHLPHACDCLSRHPICSPSHLPEPLSPRASIYYLLINKHNVASSAENLEARGELGDHPTSGSFHRGDRSPAGLAVPKGMAQGVTASLDHTPTSVSQRLASPHGAPHRADPVLGAAGGRG